MNDVGVTMIVHPAFDSLNVGVVGYCVCGHGHSSHVGRVHGHDPVFHVFHSRDHDREHSCVRRDHCHCRVNGRGHSLFGDHSPSYRAHNASSHIVCPRDDNRLFLARPSRSVKGRVSHDNEDDSQDGRSRRRVGGTAVGGIYEESADACLELEGDLGEPQIQALVEVEEWKTLGSLFVLCLFILRSIHVWHSHRQPLPPRLSLPNSVYSLGSRRRS